MTPIAPEPGDRPIAGPPAPWRSPLARALHRNRALPNARYLQLATVAPDGRPTNRTVVFRGFRDGTNALQFVTDRRSEKVRHLQGDPRAEGCWYFPKTREQFRFGGCLLAVAADGDPARQPWRQAAWDALSDRARQQFHWPHPGRDRAAVPGQPRDASPGDGFDPVPTDGGPPDPFVLLLLDPDGADWLELRGDPQNRTQYDRQPDGTWTERWVNP